MTRQLTPLTLTLISIGIMLVFLTSSTHYDDQATYSTDTSKLQQILETSTDQLHPTHFLVINMRIAMMIMIATTLTFMMIMMLVMIMMMILVENNTTISTNNVSG